jgi:hypothetical protein
LAGAAGARLWSIKLWRDVGVGGKRRLPRGRRVNEDLTSSSLRLCPLHCETHFMHRLLPTYPALTSRPTTTATTNSDSHQYLRHHSAATHSSKASLILRLAPEVAVGDPVVRSAGGAGHSAARETWNRCCSGALHCVSSIVPRLALKEAGFAPAPHPKRTLSNL